MCLSRKKRERDRERDFTQSIPEIIATLGPNSSFSLSPEAITWGHYAFGVIKIELWSNLLHNFHSKITLLWT